MEIIEILQEFFTQTRRRIQLIAIEGNHDTRRTSRGKTFPRGQSWLKVLSQLELISLLSCNFDPEGLLKFEKYESPEQMGCVIQQKGCKIYGTPYLRQNTRENLHRIYDNIPQEDPDFHILMQHFGIEGKMDNVPGQPYEDVKFLHERVDYLALGHYHLGFQIEGWVYNPGAVEAVSSGEYFYPKGIYYVEIEKKNDRRGALPPPREGQFIKHIEYIKIPNRPQIWVEIDLKHKILDSRTLYQKILETIKAKAKSGRKSTAQNKLKSQHPVLHIKLSGTSPSNFTKSREKALRKYLLENLTYPDISIRTEFNRQNPSLLKYLNVSEKMASK